MFKRDFLGFSTIVISTFLCVREGESSQDTIGPNGILSDGLMTASGLPLTGDDIAIGQVEPERAGDGDIGDNLSHRNTTIDPAGVFERGQPIPPPANSNPINELGEHAEWVAGVMISTDGQRTGVATEADLYSAGYKHTSTDDDDAYAASMAQLLANPPSGLSFDVRAINMSFVLLLHDGNSFDGNQLLSQFVDWSARHHDVLYVAAGRNNLHFPGQGIPMDNFNGITVASSAKVGNVYRQVAASNSFFEQVEGFRTAIDLIAPGDTVEVFGLGNVPSVENGTSFATPHVSGAVALLQHYVLDRLNAGAPRFDPTRSRRHEVMKAVLMNSADKLNGVHGSNRLIIDKEGMNWTESEALIGPDADLVPLDDQMGAGHLNVSRAVQQISSGEYDPDDVFGVPVIGWDYDETTGTDDINKYVFDQPLLADSFVAITIAFDRAVFLSIDDSGIIGEYDVGDTFEPYEDFMPHADDAINDLDLYLLPKGAIDFEEAIARSTSSDSTIDHIFAQIPTTGEYEFWVHQWDSDIQLQPGQPYGVAWWAEGSMPPTVVGDYSGNGTVGPEDFNVWRANFGSTTAMADGNGNGVVDAADYVVWRKNLAAGSGSFAAVPEPNGLMLIAVANVLVCRMRSLHRMSV